MKHSLYVLSLLMMLSAAAWSQVPEDDPQEAPLLFSEQINPPSLIHMDSLTLVNEIQAVMARYYVPGLSAAVIRDGEIIFKAAYGYANTQTNRPVTDSTLFTVMSVSKPFTGTALMQLYERGLFDLDDDVNDYLPYSVRNPYYASTPITFRMLLTHTSSILQNLNSLEGYETIGADSPISLDSLVENYLVPGGVYYDVGNFDASPLGSEYIYSNMGVTLLGHLVERISGIPFDQYCRDSLFTPLGMQRSAWFLSDVNLENLARPGGNLAQYSWAFYPATMLKSNATELAQFVMAFMQQGQLNGTRILDSSTVQLMTTVQNPQVSGARGLIWFVPTLWVPVGYNVYCFHSGGGRGLRSRIGYIKEGFQPMGAVLMLNGQSDQALDEIISLLIQYGVFYNHVYAESLALSASFMQAGVDTLGLTCQFYNKNQDMFSSEALITASDSSVIDSFMLYDDGAHGDLQNGDGIWGNAIVPLTDYDVFHVHVRTYNQTLDKELIQYNQAAFTTAGPLVYAQNLFFNPLFDTTFQSGNQCRFKFSLRNDGPVAVSDVRAQLLSPSPYITLGEASFGFPDLAAGSSAQSYGFFQVSIAADLPADTVIWLPMTLSSQGYAFWQDSMAIDIVTSIATDDHRIPTVYALKQNYPNPFNPATTISYQLPAVSQVELSIYNLLGQRVARLVNEKQAAGYYKVEWDASDLASGIYIYRINAGSFQAVKKMVLMK